MPDALDAALDVREEGLSRGGVDIAADVLAVAVVYRLVAPLHLWPDVDATVTFIAGWGHWDETALDRSGRRNVISIVVRVDYEGRSILFSGDAVGRSPERQATDDFNPACAHAERIMVERHDAGIGDLSADVLIAPHHGANNASSSCFIGRVDPSHVVFSAGSLHGHPRDSTARRYMDHGIPADSILRTDRGDDEGGSHGSSEWKTGTQGCRDEPGDDDVQIVLTSDGEVETNYGVMHLTNPAPCTTF